VVCSYSQILEIDFTESFSPVLNYVSFRLMHISKLVWGMRFTVVHIKMAFFHGDFNEEIYMEVPKGLIIGAEKKLILQKTIYDLVQSARKHY
jgi:hypothetical protein